MIALFLKGKCGWTESDKCWWCGEGWQRREHPFKECKRWKRAVGEGGKHLGKKKE